MSYKPYRAGKQRGYERGPRNPLDIQIPRGSKIDSVPAATLARRIRMQTTNHRMQRFRSVPVARRAWFVTLTKTKAHESELASMLVHGLSFNEREFWLHSRRMASKLVLLDQRAGGSGAMFPVECRRCCVCSRVLLASEAQAYRLKMRRPFWKWEFQEGPACGVECKPPKTNRRQPSKAA